MATIIMNDDKISIKAYLKADSFSQCFRIRNKKGEVNDLVTPDMFWGKLSEDGIYLDYTKINNRNIKVTEGISQKNGSQMLWNDLCDSWLQENVFQSNESKVFVFQGYAGCGKTTFVNHFLRKRKIDIDSFYIDIGKDWAYPQEPYMFFNEVLIKFDEYMDDIISETKVREKIWDKFIELGKDLNIKELDLQLPNIIAKFIEIKKICEWSNLRVSIHGYLNENFGNKRNHR